MSRVAKTLMLLVAATWLVLVVVVLNEPDPFAPIAAVVFTFFAGLAALLILLVDMTIRAWKGLRKPD
ncbi:MAG: hypothetical protein WKF65_09085 [Gaiellaceae bacterium]